MEGLKYYCTFCGHTMPTARRPPVEFLEKETWYVNRRPELQHCCEKCGCFAVPQILYDPLKPLDSHMFWMFAACPNAWECSLFDCYSAECEKVQLRPQCLVAIHERIGIIEHFVEKKVKKRHPKQGSALGKAD